MTDMETKVFLEEADVKKDFIPDHTENELKCPFCQQELVRHWGMKEPALYCCDNPKCSRGGVATESAWQALIRTRKALDKAKKSLQELKDIIACPPDISYETGVSMYADGVLQEITALEQKDK